jgi:hypothetical protein
MADVFKTQKIRQKNFKPFEESIKPVIGNTLPISKQQKVKLKRPAIFVV